MSESTDVLDEGWIDSFWVQIGLDDIVEEKYIRFGNARFIIIYINFAKLN